MKLAYVIGVMTSGLPDGVTASPTLGCFSTLTKVSKRIETLKELRRIESGFISRDKTYEWKDNGDIIRRVVINRPEYGGFMEILVVQKYCML